MTQEHAKAMPHTPYLSICLVAALSVPGAAAQTTLDPVIRIESLQNLTEQLRRADIKPEGIAPVRSAPVQPVRPYLPSDDHDGKAMLLPEGSFVVQLPGIVHPTPSGGWIFEPTEQDQGSTISPMVLLPSLTLTRLTQLVGEDQVKSEIRLTGEVQLYRNRNYLLVSAISVPEPDMPEAQSHPQPEPEPDAQPQLSEAANRLIRELEQTRTSDRGILQPINVDSASGRSPIPEGRTISRRRARLTHLDQGEIAIIFDNDTDQSAESPLIVLPGHLLERMEGIIERHGDALSLIVSGRTYAYAGRSFILPTSMVIEKPGELTPRQ
ncbi:MAG TPA: hypothetical protein ENJ00_08930 [Phycisphaerales bacterium]|nr:hypothetical protein [Phycisphaerales bacterium]